MTVLTQATRQWESRPADERFGSLVELHQAVTKSRTSAAVAKIMMDALRVETDGDDLKLLGKSGQPASMTNWAFNQLSSRAGAPASYLRTLPTTLAAECLNESIQKRARDDNPELQMLLAMADTGLTARAVTSSKYSRIWNADITPRLIDLEPQGWQPAPAAFDGSRGLYAGDRDMFAFLVDNDRRIFETLPGGGLSRGFFVSNSEVGDGAFNIWTFLYEFICGNHRVWGVKNVEQAKIIHIGNDQATKAWATMEVEVRKYAEASAADDEAKIESARTFQIGATKDEVLDAIFKLKLGISKTVATNAYDLAEKRVDWYGSPRSAWGYAGGLTEIGRDQPNANDRQAIDLAAGKVMEMSF